MVGVAVEWIYTKNGIMHDFSSNTSKSHLAQVLPKTQREMQPNTFNFIQLARNVGTQAYLKAF